MLQPRVYVKSKRKVFDVEQIDFFEKTIEIYDEYYRSFEDTSISFEYYTFDEVEFLENTGFKDKNGKYIYVGDIVSFKDSFEEWQYDSELSVSDGSNIAAVEKDKTNVTLTKFQSPDGMLERMLLEREVLFDDQPFEEFEVIGNIYENKELLEDI